MANGSGRDIVTNLLLNNRDFVKNAKESRRANKEMIGGISADLAKAEAQFRVDAQRWQRLGLGPTGAFQHQARRIVQMRRELAESEKMMKDALRRAEGPRQIERERRSEEQQLTRTRQLIQQVAADEVRTGKSREAQLQRLLRLEAQLAGAIERRGQLIRRAQGPQQIVRERRTEEQQLTRTRQLIQQVAAEELRSGKSREVQLQRLLRLEGQLVNAIHRRGEVISRVHAREAAAWGRTVANINMARRAQVAASTGFGRGTMVMLELSRAVEDASVVYGTTGLAGSIRASINNFTMMLTLINPMAGVIGGIAAAFTVLLIPALRDTRSEAEKVAEKLKEIEEIRNRAKGRGVIEEGVVDSSRLGLSAEGRIATEEGRRARQKMLAELSAGMTGTEAERRAVVEELRKQLASRNERLGILNTVRDDLITEIPAARAAAARGEDGAQQGLEDRLKALTEITARRAAQQQEADAISHQLMQAERLLGEKVRERIRVEGATTRDIHEERRRAKAAADAAERRRLAGLDVTSIGRVFVQNLARENERRQREEGLSGLRTGLQESLNPEAAARREIEQRRRERIAELDKLMPRQFQTFGGVRREVRNVEREALLRQINAAAAAERRGLEQDDPRRRGSDALNTGLTLDSSKGVAAVVKALRGDGRDPIVVAVKEQSKQVTKLLEKIERQNRKGVVVARGSV